jgi:hypothetical protein
MSTVKIDFNRDPALIEIVSRRAGDEFEKRYANLLQSFDVNAVYSAIAAFLRLQEQLKPEDFTVPAILARTEEGFRQLLQRGALSQFQKFDTLPAAAQVELDQLFGIDEAETAAQEHVAQISQHQDQIAQCAKDWRALPSADFKRKWPRHEHQATIEAAWLLLETQDNELAAGYRGQREAREAEANGAFGRKFW